MINCLSNKQFALNILYAAQIDRQERISHPVSVQMVDVGFHSLGINLYWESNESSSAVELFPNWFFVIKSNLRPE